MANRFPEEEIAILELLFELIARGGLAIKAGAQERTDDFLRESAIAVANMEEAKDILALFRVQELLVMLAGTFAVMAYDSDSGAAVQGYSFVDWCRAELQNACEEFIAVAQEVNDDVEDTG
jgi:hypothetical protein